MIPYNDTWHERGKEITHCKGLVLAVAASLVLIFGTCGETGRTKESQAFAAAAL